MASYATDPRTGLLVVTQDDGTQLPGMMPEMAPQFDAMGMTRAVDGPSHVSAPGDGGGGNAFDMGAPPTADQVPTDGAPQLSHAFEGFAPPPPGAGPAMTPGQAAVAGAMGDNISHTGGSRPQFDPNEFNRDPADSFQGAPPRNKLAGPSAPEEKPKSGTTKLSIGEDGSVAPVGGGRGGGAKFVDVPLSKLRVTRRQVEHSLTDPITGEDADKYYQPLDDEEQRLGFRERRDKLDRDNALLLAEKKYYADKKQLQEEEKRQSKINDRTRLLEYERNELDKEAKNASVDPKRYFNDMSIWTKMVAAIGATLQGAAMGLSGQGGGMPPIIGLMQELNREDIEGQKVKMESAVARGKLANDRYEKALALWGDPDMAEMQMERDKLALTDGWLARQQAAQQADSQASDAFAGMRQSVQERRLAIDEKLSLFGKAKVTDEQQATPQRLVGGGGGSGASASNKLRQRIVKMPDGTLKFAQDEKGAENARKFMQATAVSQRLGREIIELRKQSGAWERATGSGKGAELKAKVNMLRLNEKNRYELGQLTGADTDIMPVPDAEELFESGVEETLSASIEEAGVQAQDYAAQYLSDDPAGTIMPEGAISGR